MASRTEVVYLKRMDTADPVAVKPKKRRKVLLPCPNRICSQLVTMDWVCFDCQADIEYAFDEKYLFCSCGRSDLTKHQFKCPYDEAFIEDEDTLRNIFGILEPPKEFNILLLGEAGVGKSTFINSFANYLAYSTVEEAIKGNIITLIPNEFDVIDENYRLVHVKNGQMTQDEDTSEIPATRIIKTHKFIIGNTILKIIDTPGYVDVRQATLNFVDILYTIDCDSLNGIAIFFKANNSKIDSIKELSTLLPKKILKNLIFCFTGTDSKSGALPALVKLLTNQANAIKPNRKRIYSFDSQSYRLLSAMEKGVKFDDDSERTLVESWINSVKETDRMMKYIKNLTPYNPRECHSLNIRVQVVHFNKVIVEAVTKQIQLIDHLKEIIKHVRKQVKVLSSQLKVEKVELEHVELMQPRTICTNDFCVITDEINGIVTRTHVTCHEDCSCKVETTGQEDLIHCEAMDGECCRECGHHFTEHIRVAHEIRKEILEVEDESVKKEIKKKASFRKQISEELAEARQVMKQFDGEYLESCKILCKLEACLGNLEEEETVISSLCQLKHFGEAFERIKRARVEELVQGLLNEVEYDQSDFQNEPGKTSRLMENIFQVQK